MHQRLRNQISGAIAVFFVPAVVSLAQDPRALEVLQKADAATKAVKACSYTGESWSKAQVAVFAPKKIARIHGKFLLRDARVGFFNRLMGKASHQPPAIRADVTIKPVGGGPDKHLRVAAHDRFVTFIDDDEKYWLTQEMPAGESLLNVAKQLHMIEFSHPTPFTDELTGRVQKYERSEEVVGEPCDVVYVEYQQEGLKARWYFSQRDHLPRRVDRIFASGRAAGTRTLMISDLDVNPSISESDFEPPCPTCYEKRALTEKWRSDLLAPGTKAPDWSLKTPEGKTVKLSDLRGEVVVMEFWSTWCVYCKESLPEVQKLHERYKDRGLKVVAICCWDKTEKAGATAKAMRLSFDTLVDGDQVAEDYLVAGLPTYYVIDAQGKIAHAGAGAKQIDALRDAIEETLKKSAK